MTLIIGLFVIAILLSVGGGAWAQPNYGYYSYSPLALIILVFVILWFIGAFH